MTKPWEETLSPSPSGHDDITPRVWREDGVLVAHVATDAHAAFFSAAPEMARDLIAVVRSDQWKTFPPLFQRSIIETLAKAGILHPNG